jgi:hypothetical protein
MWFKCSEQLFKTDQPVFFGVVYIPPEYTKYSSEDAFSELQQEYLSFSNKSKYICLLGDFSARTTTDTDFVDLIKNVYFQEPIIRLFVFQAFSICSDLFYIHFSIYLLNSKRLMSLNLSTEINMHLSIICLSLR